MPCLKGVAFCKTIMSAIYIIYLSLNFGGVGLILFIEKSSELIPIQSSPGPIIPCPSFREIAAEDSKDAQGHRRIHDLSGGLSQPQTPRLPHGGSIGESLRSMDHAKDQPRMVWGETGLSEGFFLTGACTFFGLFPHPMNDTRSVLYVGAT